MRLRLLVVGRGSKELSDFEARFLERLKPFASCQVIELPEGRGKQVSQRKQEEAKHILQQARKGFVLFDERGAMHGSVKWAEYLGRLHGDAQLDFVIGGADGLADSVRAEAGACWSLSKLTLPHQLVRAVVLEQLYRAFTIIQGHPYHRV
ncbi:23S rRNA (pseudouridine(1915)-N(3))-methyltransferase RlmH [Mariprofundus sp. EBB-1]|uniref:23S rRNA (pseudouridine(1915)-N(3))-methyltransferase RlmH n=1 Tax=Mariprofundus sp. EBB-1 TaxID=2650971 RepID=UPI000EF1D6C4|nr:23S rRNA (pseudouridine(1915)-N(3))-methyltransferase RlmH [Mariprofundus sp. EBB-1]RLL55068.1 23S rRNA (pseudouridine(1915)-N(3))-methyltransferase RlmH [Mariprofundus sp. EBB-1]